MLQVVLKGVACSLPPASPSRSLKYLESGGTAAGNESAFPTVDNIEGVRDVDHAQAFHGNVAIPLCLKEAPFYLHL